MQNAGTLKKRARRSLVKVNGLGSVPYDEKTDTHTVSDFIGKNKHGPFTLQTDSDIRLNIGSGSSLSNSSRITRDPKYHEDYIMSPDLDMVDEENPPVYNISQEIRNHNQPYLFSRSIFNRLQIILFLSMFCLNAPWIWNNKKKRIERWNTFMTIVWKVYWYFTTVQSIGMIIYHSYCFIGLYSSNLESYRGIFAYFLIIYWYACHLGYKTTIFLYEEQMRRYVNLLLDFNHQYVERFLVYADKDTESSSGRMVMKLSIPAAGSQILNSLFFFIVMPYQPYYLTSHIDPRPWYALIPGVWQDWTLVGQTILTYITISWMQIAHTTSVEFWLKEMHKDADSIYTLDDIRHPKIAVSTYRQLQLLCSLYNEFMAPLAYPVWKFSVALGFIPCGYLWIRSMNHLFVEEFPGILVYPFGAVNCFTMGFGCLSMAAEMYDIANSFIYSWSRTRQKNFRRVLMSCPTLKAKVGRYYFITAATTITFFQVITGYVIDCIITFP